MLLGGIFGWKVAEYTTKGMKVNMKVHKETQSVH